MSLESVHNNRKMLMEVLKEMYQDTYRDVWEDYFIKPAEPHGYYSNPPFIFYPSYQREGYVQVVEEDGKIVTCWGILT